MSKAGSPAGSSAPIFAFTSPIWLDGHAVSTLQGVCEYASEPSGCGVPVPPAKWSPSSTVTTNSVLSFVIPSCASRVKNALNAAS